MFLAAPLAPRWRCSLAGSPYAVLLGKFGAAGAVLTGALFRLPVGRTVPAPFDGVRLHPEGDVER